MIVHNESKSLLLKLRRRYLYVLVQVSGMNLNGPRAGKPIEFDVCTHYTEEGRLIPDRGHFDWLMQVAKAKVIEP